MVVVTLVVVATWCGGAGREGGGAGSTVRLMVWGAAGSRGWRGHRGREGSRVDVEELGGARCAPLPPLFITRWAGRRTRERVRALWGVRLVATARAPPPPRRQRRRAGAGAPRRGEGVGGGGNVGGPLPADGGGQVYYLLRQHGWCDVVAPCVCRFARAGGVVLHLPRPRRWHALCGRGSYLKQPLCKTGPQGCAELPPGVQLALWLCPDTHPWSREWHGPIVQALATYQYCTVHAHQNVRLPRLSGGVACGWAKAAAPRGAAAVSPARARGGRLAA